jgi:hypothetical protein
MPLTSDALTNLYKRRQESPDPEPENQGGHVLSFLWNAISPETKRVFDKYMGGQYEGAGYQDVAADFLPENPYAVAQPNALGIVLNAGKQVSKLPENVPYKDILTKFLDDPNVVVPYIPKSHAEPVVAKSATQNVAPVAEAMGWPQYGKSMGFRTSLPEGSMVATTVERQGRTIPHEFGHEIQRAWQREPVFGESLSDETLDMFAALHPALRDQYLARWGKWPTYNNASKFANELTADFVDPETFAKRFPDALEKLAQAKQGVFSDLPPISQEYSLGHLKEALANRFPSVGAFWDEVPGRIPKNVYDLPEGWK